MRDWNRVDVGTIKIHKKVIADIVAAAVGDVPGVSLLAHDPWAAIKDLLGMASIPGVVVSIDEHNSVNVEVRINVRYGVNLPDAARQAQDAVRAAIEKTVDVDLKDVSVSVQGLERGPDPAV